MIGRLRSVFGGLARVEDPSRLYFLLVGSFIDAPFTTGDCSGGGGGASDRNKYTQGAAQQSPPLPHQSSGFGYRVFRFGLQRLSMSQ